jgi:uncharacterized protein (DUF111 family)
MEGALASVVGGLVSCPVIGVPTSIGYGAGTFERAMPNLLRVSIGEALDGELKKACGQDKDH